MEPANTEAKPVAATGQTSGAETVTRRYSIEADNGLASTKPIIIDVNSVDFHYGSSKALHGISLKVPEKQVRLLGAGDQRVGAEHELQPAGAAPGRADDEDRLLDRVGIHGILGTGID